MLENLKLGFIILLTGIVVVFFVLLLLIGIIKLYSTIVCSIQDNIKNKQIKKEKDNQDKAKEKEKVVAPVKAEASVVEQSVKSDDGSVPGEIVAAIAAAVETIFGQGAVKIKAIKKSPSSKRRSAWKSAGVAENTRSF